MRRSVITLFAFVLAFTHCVFSDVSSNCLPERSAHPSIHVLSLYKRMKSHISCIYLTFSNVCFQMSPHVACPSGCKITLAALVCSFSGVCFQIFPQTVYPGGCVIILFTSVWFFSNVSNVYSNAPHERIHSHIGCTCSSSVCVFSCPEQLNR